MRPGDGLASVPTVRLVLPLIALCVAAFWSGMLFFGGHALGVPIAPEWLLAFSAVIFLIALLSLSINAVGSDGASDQDQPGAALATGSRIPAASTPLQ